MKKLSRWLAHAASTEARVPPTTGVDVGARAKAASEEKTRSVPVDALLLGGVGALAADKYAAATGEFLRPSTPMRRSPEMQLLDLYAEHGERVFDDETLKSTAYYKTAANSMRLAGNYYGASDAAAVRALARKFIGREYYKDRSTRAGGNAAWILAAPIADSNCFQVREGAELIAGKIFHGAYAIDIESTGVPVHTPVQSLLMSVKGKLELYQPVDLPELTTWPLIRRCVDRLFLIKDFLSRRGLRSGSYIDLACSFGWFTKEFARLGFEAYGIEMNPRAVEVGQKIYGLSEAQIKPGVLPQVLHQATRQYDVVSLLSIAHHFVFGEADGSAEDLIRAADGLTGRILFFDTGQSHEIGYRERLPEWTPEFIENWLRKHTTFSEIVQLGTDLDSVPPYAGVFRRTLFACVR